MRRFATYASMAALAAPLSAFAATAPTTFKDLVQNYFIPILNITIAVLVAGAVAVFFFGLVRYIASSAGAEERVRGRELILWGLTALVALACLWGIVSVLRITFLGASSGTNQSYQPASQTEPLVL